MEEEVRIHKKKFRVVVKVLTGLHIGGTKDVITVGGVDNKVIRTYYNREYVPIIPGSSLKGKMRSLLEIHKGWIIDDVEGPIATKKEVEKIWDKLKKSEDENKKKEFIAFLKLFGTQPNIDIEIEEKSLSFGIGRAIFSDLYPTVDTIAMWREKDLIDYVEIKTENSVNRVLGNASHPRKMERVIPGSEFEGTIIFQLLPGDEKYLEQMEKILCEGIELLNNSYLGGSGTRGYGRVEVKLEECRDNKEE